MISTSPPTLLSIVALARSGALERAWAAFEAGGFGEAPAALTVRGRLLKDRARQARGDERDGLFREAAVAYERAAAGSDNPAYPLINAATLSRLAGDEAGSRRLAERVLALIDQGQDGPETPYYREATRAEALLLLGRHDQAQASLAAAVALAPKAWEDHASTLRQFGLILEAQGQDAGWLDAHRPPRTLHFAGHMGLGIETDALTAEVADFLGRERVGFGYGALAAGADIVIAESLAASGAELHVVLPADPEAFATASVGADWRRRYEAVLARADTVEVAGRPSPLADAAGNQLAAETAMGRAAMQAQLLMTEAVQLLVLDAPGGPGGRPGGSAWIGSRWLAGGRRQTVLVAAREAARPGREEDAAERTLAAVVAVRPDGGDWEGVRRIEAEVLPRLAGVLGGRGPMLTPPRWSAGGLTLAFATPADAAASALAAAQALRDIGPARIAAHYGPVRPARDPFGGPDLLLGPAAELPERLLASTPQGAIHVSGDFACALAAGPEADCPRLEPVGELPLEEAGEALSLYSLQARPSQARA